VARTLTPERQKLKEEAMSLRYDYGWDIRRIAGQLDVKKSTIHLWVSNNIGMGLSNNNGHITHLEGDKQ
jgi:transposase